MFVFGSNILRSKYDMSVELGLTIEIEPVNTSVKLRISLFGRNTKVESGKFSIRSLLQVTLITFLVLKKVYIKLTIEIVKEPMAIQSNLDKSKLIISLSEVSISVKRNGL